MKNLIITIILLLLCVPFLQAQQTVTPSQINQPLTNPQTLTAQPGKNYIRSYTYRSDTDTAFTKLYNTNIDIQYFDGLGRAKETVQLAASPTGKDIVALQTYDAYGRADTTFLPYSSATIGGVFVSRPSVISTSAMPAYLSSNFDLLGTDNQFGFSKPEYDGSPLNRVLKQGAPGADWQPNQHPVQFDYQTNTSALPSWKYAEYSYSSISYEAGKLYVTLTTDEDGNQSRTYTDLQGKVVMKEAYDGTNWLKTRYCYDDFGLLRCVLQPMATDPSSTEYCFYYRYDIRHRLTDKKVPGSGWVWMVYDYKDRLALTSDEVSRSIGSPVMKWYFTKYDDFNRPTQTGILLANSTTREALVAYYASNTAIYGGNSSMYYPHEIMVYDAVPATAPYNTCSFVANALAASTELATSTKGLLVAKWSSILKPSEPYPYPAITDVYYYDKYARVIQTVRKNHLGYIERISNDYNFAGQITQTRTEHYYSATNAYIVDTYYKYDHRGRLIQTDYKVDTNGNDVEQTIVSANVYNEAGQLKTKYLHSKAGEAFLQKIDYKYNIRGWLTTINDPGLSVESDRFGLQLYYNRNTNGTTAYWNGNIRAQKWGNGGRLNQVNTYTYDHANRITSGNYPTGSNPSYSFLSTYTYDKNGNFNSLTRRGFSGAFIDQIAFGYKGGNSNRLDYATDASGDVAGVEDFSGTLTGPNHYQYDANGNLTRDDYRALNLSYNSFNLPWELDFGSNKKVIYFYNGAGQKLTKRVETGSGSPLVTEYLGQFVHEYTLGGTSSLKYIITPEGRLKNTGTNAAPVWAWEYNLTDHLGNVRVVIRPMANNYAEILEYNNYFPFGMKMTPYLCQTTTDNKYLYNGKEQQSDFGLNWYDYGARFYDPALGRWHSADPLAEVSRRWSPYTYCYNNPMRFIDPDGMDPIYGNNLWGNTKLIGDDGKEDGNAYLVKGSVKREVKSSTKEGKDYSGSLSESKNVMKVPTGGVMDDVVSSVDATLTSQKENGGSSNTGDANATRWDEGSPAKEVKDAEGNVVGAKASMNPFMIGGTQNIPTDASNVEFYWHTHPNTTVGGVSLGYSDPSDADKSFQGTMQNRGFKGNAFVIGTRSNTVTFYNKNKSLITIKYLDFKKIGGK